MIEKRRPNITPCNLAEELNDVNYKYFKIQLFHKLLIQFLNNWLKMLSETTSKEKKF